MEGSERAVARCQGKMTLAGGLLGRAAGAAAGAVAQGPRAAVAAQQPLLLSRGWRRASSSAPGQPPQVDGKQKAQELSATLNRLAKECIQRPWAKETRPHDSIAQELSTTLWELSKLPRPPSKELSKELSTKLWEWSKLPRPPSK